MSSTSAAAGISYWTRRHMSVELQDSTGAHAITVPSGEGDVSISNLNAGGVEAVPVYNRGCFEGMVTGDDSTHDFSVTCRIARTALTVGTQQSIMDALLYLGDWSDATTPDQLGDINSHRVVIRLSNTGSTSSIILLENARLTGTFTDGEIVTLAISGTCYSTPLFDADATAAL